MSSMDTYTLFGKMGKPYPDSCWGVTNNMELLSGTHKKLCWDLEGWIISDYGRAERNEDDFGTLLDVGYPGPV